MRELCILNKERMVRSFSTLGMKTNEELKLGRKEDLRVGLNELKTSEIKEVKTKDLQLAGKQSIVEVLKYIEYELENNDSIDYDKKYADLVSYLKALKDINKKGYINDMNLSNYPMISDWITLIINDESSSYGIEEQKGLTTIIDDKHLFIKDAELLYKWSYNLFILKLYKVTEMLIYKMSIKEREEDLYQDYKTLSKELYDKIDLSIRSKLMKKGMGITRNVYTGFDTEYQIPSQGGIYNKLLSVQASITVQSSIKLPLQEAFDFKEISVLTGKHLEAEIKSSIIKWEVLKRKIQLDIDSIRYLKYGNFDAKINLLISELKNYKNEQGNSLTYVNSNESIIFMLERSLIKQFYESCSKYKFEDLVKKSLEIAELDKELIKIKNLLDELSSKIKNLDIVPTDKELEKVPMKEALKIVNEKIESFSTNFQEADNRVGEYSKDDVTKVKSKKYTRTNNTSYTSEVLSITDRINNYMIAHYTPADMSMFEDFEKYKNDLDIVNKSFVTLNKPILINGVNVILRDSKLIAPSGYKTLDALSTLYKSIPKIKISKEDYENMSLFQERDPDLFKRYALQDTLIALIHGCYMQEFNNLIGGIGIPVTLSSLAGNYIRKYWKDTKYYGYQLSHKYLMTNVSRSLTPKGLSVLKEIGIKSTMYIANYKGGRNESFMYGYEKETFWTDVDLISAYTTVMKILGTPDYKKGRILSSRDLLRMSRSDMINSYTILSVDFKFPDDVKYPSIPCDVEEGTISYPLSGSSLITSIDYLVAKKQGAVITIKEGYTVPFKMIKVEDKYIIEKPFKDCIEEIQKMRSNYPKGTINNALWKEIGNSIYGLIVRGINEKMKFDSRSGGMKRMEGNDLSNPLIAGWITSFVRSIIGELLHGVQLLDGKAVSVTTDGFISDIQDLENKIQELKIFNKSLYNEYRKISGGKDVLEVKNSGWGILSWCTRGQHSLDAKILAATGFQKDSLSHEKIHELFLECLKTSKELTFIQKQLRSGKDIFKKGGHVTEVLSERIFRMHYDNKRFILEDENKTLLDSKPLNSPQESSLLRYIGKLPKNKFYSANTGNTVTLKYKSRLDVAIRNFIKALFEDKLNLINTFENYKDLAQYIHDYDKVSVINVNTISQLKRRGNFTKVPRTTETEDFVKYIKIKFPNFDELEFFKN